MKEISIYRALYNSPVGFEVITATDHAVISILYRDEKPQIEEVTNDITINCVAQLDEYFAGKRKSFDVRIAPAGTEFQLMVWNELVKIPYGETISYHELSRRLKNEKAIRAVGAANGKNPINIIIPCHRVIGADGSLTGYGGGLWRKKWLLEHESEYSTNEKQLSFF